MTDIRLIKVEIGAYREQLLDGSVLLTIPMKAMIEAGVTYEELHPRGWRASETRLAVEKRIVL